MVVGGMWYGLFGMYCVWVNVGNVVGGVMDVCGFFFEVFGCGWCGCG